jgi:PST family polysaccharide transporter
MLRFLKAIATTGGASVVTMLLGLAANKILAVVMGPTGIGLLASYRSIQDTTVGLGSMAGAAAQVQGLSSVEGEARRLRLVACVWLALTGMAAFTLVLLIAAPAIAEHFFRDPSPEIVAAIRWMVVTLCVALAASVASGLVNVSGAIGWLALVQVGASAAAAAAAWPLAVLAGEGSQLAYLGMILVPLAVQFLLAGTLAWRLGWLPMIGSAFRQLPARADLAHFMGFFVANLGGGLIASAGLLALRATIIETEGQAANGLFQASWTLTSQNLTLLMASFGTYLLPLLSTQHDEAERNRVLDEALPVVIVLTVPLAGVGLLFMPLILRLLYSEAFLPAIEPLRWMLLANLFSALITAFYVLLAARGRPLISAVTEIGWYVGFAGIGMVVLSGLVDPARVGLGRLESLGFAFFVMNALRLSAQIVLCRKVIPYAPAPVVWRTGAAGFVILLVAAWIGWSARDVNWLLSMPAAVIVCATPLLLLNRQRLAQLGGLLRGALGR